MWKWTLRIKVPKWKLLKTRPTSVWPFLTLTIPKSKWQLQMKWRGKMFSFSSEHMSHTHTYRNFFRAWCSVVTIQFCMRTLIFLRNMFPLFSPLQRQYIPQIYIGTFPHNYRVTLSWRPNLNTHGHENLEYKTCYYNLYYFKRGMAQASYM